MFTENNLRKKKPEGTFTNPDIANAPVAREPEIDLYTEPIYESPVVEKAIFKAPPKKKTTNTPKIQPLKKGGFGVIR